MACLMLLFLSTLVLTTLTTLPGTHAVTYSVKNNAPNTPGGQRFTREIGIPYCLSTLRSATEYIWQTFKQNTAADRKNVPSIEMFVETMGGVANTVNNEIHVSAGYIARYNGDVKKEITGVMIHEAVHIWQWNGRGNAPGGLIEGIADYVRLKRGYAPSHWKKRGEGDRWDQGYDVTAYFLEYCEGLRGGFVAYLNRRMRTGYSHSYFADYLGKSVDQLWRDYKRKYST